MSEVRMQLATLLAERCHATRLSQYMDASFILTSDILKAFFHSLTYREYHVKICYRTKDFLERLIEVGLS